MVSSELLWHCVRRTSCFLKRSNGITLTSEPQNLTQKNTLRHSGLCHQQPVGLELAGRGDGFLKLSIKQKKGRKMRFPRAVVMSRKMQKSRKSFKTIFDVVAPARPDLVPVVKKRLHKLTRTGTKTRAE